MPGRWRTSCVWFAGLLGEVRDREVLEARLLADLAELPPELVVGPVAAQIETELTTQRKVAWDAVIAVLDDDRYRRLLAELHRWRSDAPLTKEAKAPAATVKTYVKRAGKKLDKRLDRAIEAQLTGDPEADHLLHAARKAGKRARYAVELAAPVLGKKADKLIASRKDLQDVLGEHQDSIVAAAFLRAEGVRVGIRSGHNGFTYGAAVRPRARPAGGHHRPARSLPELSGPQPTRPERIFSTAAAIRRARVSGRLASTTARTCSLRWEYASASKAARTRGSASRAAPRSSGTSSTRSASSSSIVAVTASPIATPSSVRAAWESPIRFLPPIPASRSRAVRSPMVTRTGARLPPPSSATCASVSSSAVAGPTGSRTVEICSTIG